MMGPDYTHWHGTYEVAKHFYAKLIPELEHLVEKHHDSGDTAKREGARNLKNTIDEVLNTPDHRWYLGKMDPKEAAARKEAAEKFKAQYK